MSDIMYTRSKSKNNSTIKLGNLNPGEWFKYVDSEDHDPWIRVYQNYTPDVITVNLINGEHRVNSRRENVYRISSAEISNVKMGYLNE